VDIVSFPRWLEAVIPPLTFLLILWALLKPKYSRRITLWAAVGFWAAEAVVQEVILALGDSPELVFTLLPLTFYLPAIVCLHLLSERPRLPTALTWLLALLCDLLLVTAQKLLNFLLSGLNGVVWMWASAAILLAAAALLLTLIFRFFRAPFLSYIEELEGGWLSLLSLPVMLLALYSYFLSSVTNVTVLLLLFFTALAAFAALARLMVSLAEAHRARDARSQMKALRQDYEVLQKKLELGRSSRHDMRHHMTALSALLQKGDYSEAQRYMANWQGQLVQIETKTWCRNAAVNAVLSAYLAQAEEAGYALETDIALPQELPFEEVDLCVVLANALENAIHACEAELCGTPSIKLFASLTDQRRLTIRVENSYHWPIEFDSNGFPIVPHQEGHGQGLKSISAVAEKYHGLFQCDCKDGTFTLRVVLLNAAPEPQRVRRAPSVFAGVLLCLFLLNCMPNLAQAMENIPVLGQLIRVVDLRSWALGWGDSGITVQDPVLEGSSPAVDELTAQKDAFIAQMQETFLEYAARKYQGYVAEDVSYEVIRDDEDLFLLRLTATLNAGGSVDYSRYLLLDKSSGQILELADLFQPEVNYIFPISREIKAQMSEQINAGEGNYFLPGGIWADEECFQSIDPEQNFYINENGQLVIVFAEYEVAPGSMGTPEFVIPTDVLDGLLAQPSVLR